jgi:hypothetical protein
MTEKTSKLYEEENDIACHRPNQGSWQPQPTNCVCLYHHTEVKAYIWHALDD